MGELNWTDKAVKHLNSIFEYISNDSKVYASRFVRSLQNEYKVLTEFPKIGRIVPELNIANIREIQYRNYRIVYRAVENNIYILAIIHKAREFPETIE